MRPFTYFLSHDTECALRSSLISKSVELLFGILRVCVNFCCYFGQEALSCSLIIESTLKTSANVILYEVWLGFSCNCLCDCCVFVLAHFRTFFRLCNNYQQLVRFINLIFVLFIYFNILLLSFFILFYFILFYFILFYFIFLLCF